MTIAFEKMHANGDDFVIVDCRMRDVTLPPDLIRRLGDRQRGIGFNQIAILRHCENATADLSFWNADGTSLAACGSATRGVAGKLMGETGADDVTVRTSRGILRCMRHPDGQISVDMGLPLLLWSEIPLAEAMDTARLPLAGDPAACSMGNPHCTFFVDDIDQVDVEARGREFETHPLFPNRTNVHFVQVLDPVRIRLRIWERGAGISPGSGSCSCAAVVNGIRRGLLSEDVDVLCDGGLLRVSWNGRDGVQLAGPVEPVFCGEWTA
ncbi:diaminopimelate epimerase [Sphingomonas morindae]|uniref:Diaminopimelate epimerase n=1 Tax=Sphingomonas morindae TaxID=1541170 RepID=A0ABY4X3Z7_9SPHN|nr:diaminopimelate epimerase [Sphingomonas morindae]USI71567.1 diaminopimelate epimerase [Sphingomonas morindae]